MKKRRWSLAFGSEMGVFVPRILILFPSPHLFHSSSNIERSEYDDSDDNDDDDDVGEEGDNEEKG